MMRAAGAAEPKSEQVYPELALCPQYLGPCRAAACEAASALSKGTCA